MNENQQSQLKELITKGKEQGFLTYAQVNDHLPDDIVLIESVKDFQSKLTHIAKWRAEHHDPHWKVAYQSCGDMLNFFHS